MNILVDTPISSKEQDKLNRCEFVELFSKIILSREEDDGLVLLLNGKWGTGKSSLVNLIKEQINEEIKNNKELRYIPIVHDFSPWNVISQDSIISQFFDSLSSGFLKTKIRKTLKKIKNSIVFQKVFNTLNYIPLINRSPAWKAIACLKNEFDDYVNSFNTNKNLLERKEEIAETLKKSLTRHIVFIDDLDRMNDSEIKLVIQLIKSVCNLPNVIYVLTADVNILKNALKNEQLHEGEGNKYLEKIIQATFDLPEIKSDCILGILDDDLKIIFGSKLNEEDVRRINMYRYLGMFDLVRTIRDEKRFFNSLSITFDAYRGELDIPDFIAISYLKFINPQIIQLLVDYSNYLFGTSIYNSEDLKQKKNEFVSNLKNICNSNVYPLILEMFPNMFSTNSENKELYLSKRICSHSRFNLFLTLQLDSDDLSINRFNVAIKNKQYSDLVALNTELSTAQGRRFLLHLVNYLNSSNTIDDCEFVVKFLLKNLSSVKIQNNSFLTPAHYYVLDFIKGLCKRYSSDKTYAIITKYISDTSDMYALSEIAIDLNLKNEKNQYGFSELDTKMLTEKVCDILMKKISAKSLSIPHKARSIRLVYEQNPELLKTYFDTLDESQKINFLCEMIWDGSMYDEKKHVTFSYTIDWIDYLLGEINVYHLITSNFELLSNKNKQRALVLLMQKSGIKPLDVSGTYYLVEDIQNYCIEKDISFNASDEYESE